MELNDRIRESLTKQLSQKVTKDTFQVEVQTSTIKEYKSTDLPIYKKWTHGVGCWIYRCRMVDGKIKCDIIKVFNNEYEYTTSNITNTFHRDNIDITEDEWRNAMHNFLKYLKK